MEKGAAVYFLFLEKKNIFPSCSFCVHKLSCLSRLRRELRTVAGERLLCQS
uniref:Glucocorticoid receptor alpha-2 mRNA n=1 Tax=Homo sapiens TaxID=9606 RepID=A2NCZ2_HUMAN|nr:putative upstream ORF [Homo sapiens]